MTLPPSEVLAQRVARLRDRLAADGVDALAVTSLPNIAYLTGLFASSAGLVVSPDRLVLISDGRYAEALAARADAWSVITPVQLAPEQSYDQAIVDAIEPLRGLRIGIEAGHVSLQRYRFITKALVAKAWTDELAETSGVVEGLRVRKDAWERERIRDGASRLSDAAKCILSKPLAGRTEADVALEIDRELRRAGFERLAFDTIVASGPNAAQPHARAGSRRIEPGDLVLMDFGGVLDGYCTDLTRTVTAGRGESRAVRLIEQVIEAQAAAFEMVAAGSRPEHVDAAARRVLDRHGIAEAFTHGTGHGLGLEVHEAPRVTRRRPDHDEPPLDAGMVLTLEPGAYFAGWGGVRIEDDVLVTDRGAEWLTDVPRGC